MKFLLWLQNWNENSSNFEIDWTFKSRNETNLKDGLKELSISIICFISQKRFCLKTKTIKRIYSVIISLIVNNHNIFFWIMRMFLLFFVSPHFICKNRINHSNEWAPSCLFKYDEPQISNHLNAFCFVHLNSSLVREFEANKKTSSLLPRRKNNLHVLETDLIRLKCIEIRQNQKAKKSANEGTSKRDTAKTVIEKVNKWKKGRRRRMKKIQFYGFWRYLSKWHKMRTRVTWLSPQ